MPIFFETEVWSEFCYLLVNKQLPAGTLLVELIYMIESQSPKGLQLNRFLPPTPVRLLLDSKGNDLAGQVNFGTLQNKLKPLSKDIANKMVKMARPNIEQLIKLGDHKITEIAQTQIREASKLADQTLSTELNRLLATQIGRASVGKECRSRWSPYH